MKKQLGLYAAIAMMAAAPALSIVSPVHAAEDPVLTGNTVNEIQIEEETEDNPHILELKEVPRFHFGTVAPMDVYEGFSASGLKSGTLKVSDGRTTLTGWTLTGKFSPFKKGENSDPLNLSTLSFTGDKVNGKSISSDEADTRLYTHPENNGGITEDENLAATLVQESTKDADVKAGNTFTANLTWTLSTDADAGSL